MKNYFAWMIEKQLYIRMGTAALLLGASFFAGGWFCFTLALSALLLVGIPIFWSAASRLFRGELLDETFLMSLAAVGAFAIGEYAEGVAVILFYLVGEEFEKRSVRRARKMIKSLMDIRPDNARVEREGEIAVLPSEEVLVGDIVVLRGGERVPVDGEVISGNGVFDTSAITGESFPLDANEGVSLCSGMLCLSGAVKMRCTKVCEDSSASRILALVSEAQSRKSKQETFISAFARIYTPVVVALAVLVAVIPGLIWGSWSEWIHTALVFLVVSCPCALLISVPLSFFGGIGGGASVGILFKGGQSFEALAKCKIAVFDKTGTATEGVLSVKEICTEPRVSQEEILQIAASLEQFSVHPIAKAVTKKAQGMPLFEISGLKEHSGQGLEAKLLGQRVLVGNSHLLKENNIPYPAAYEEMQVLVVKGESFLGGIALKDTPREGMADAIEKMKGLGITKTVMLSGDKAGQTEEIASSLGIDLWAGELLPDDKYRHLEELISEGKGVLFIGDGINDVPSLARADVGIAMGGVGSDSAIEVADVVLADDSPAALPRAISIARRTVSIARANVVFALTVKFAVMLISLLGVLEGIMWLAVFADVGVSVIAILNAMRCLNVKN